MYSREYGQETFTFEPSGGLLHASLVMQDRETDSYWSITTEEAIYGPGKGKRLNQLAGAEKIKFGEWKARHPDTLVLSVDGVEHDTESPYDRYFASEDGFRKLEASDSRLGDKAAVFVFHRRSGPWAVDQSLFADGGAVIELDDRRFFFYREADDSHYRSTSAFLIGRDQGIEKGAEGWIMTTPNGRSIDFDLESRSFRVPSRVLVPVDGFDTFWYIWSLSNPGTGLVTAEATEPPNVEESLSEELLSEEPPSEKTGSQGE